MLHRQLDGQRIRFEAADRAWLAELLHCLPRPNLHSLRLLVRPNTILRWHRELIAAATRPCRRPPQGPATDRPIDPYAGDTPGPGEPLPGYRRIHGEPPTLAITVATSTVWTILHAARIDPAPQRAATTWAQFLRSQADAWLAAYFIEPVTLTGTRLYVLAAIEPICPPGTPRTDRVLVSSGLDWIPEKSVPIPSTADRTADGTQDHEDRADNQEDDANRIQDRHMQEYAEQQENDAQYQHD